MLEENLIGYLLKALDPEETRQVERAFQDDPETRRRLELLERALQPLAADREHLHPPADLRYRVLARVAENRLANPRRRLRPPPFSSDGAGRSWWRRADVLVAAVSPDHRWANGAGYFLRQIRFQISQCQNNLRSFHAALMAIPLT